MKTTQFDNKINVTVAVTLPGCEVLTITLPGYAVLTSLQQYSNLQKIKGKQLNLLEVKRWNFQTFSKKQFEFPCSTRQR